MKAERYSLDADLRSLEAHFRDRRAKGETDDDDEEDEEDEERVLLHELADDEMYASTSPLGGPPLVKTKKTPRVVAEDAARAARTDANDAPCAACGGITDCVCRFDSKGDDTMTTRLEDPTLLWRELTGLRAEIDQTRLDAAAASDPARERELRAKVTQLETHERNLARRYDSVRREVQARLAGNGRPVADLLPELAQYGDEAWAERVRMDAAERARQEGEAQRLDGHHEDATIKSIVDARRADTARKRSAWRRALNGGNGGDAA